MKKRKLSPFTAHVYAVVKKIPRGMTLTYGQVAMAVGRPGAARAVGTALSKNFDKTIPCHRVIRADGKVGSYNRGGWRQKTKILKKEKAL